MVTKDTMKKSASLEFMHPREKPKELPFRQRFSKFMYNPEKGRFMGRTPEDWGKLGLFYCIFFGILAIFCALLFAAFWRSIDPRIPKYKLDESIIGTNPGLGFRPMPRDNALSSLIKFQTTEDGPLSYQYWVNSTRDFLSDYKNQGKVEGAGQDIISSCDYNTKYQPGKACGFTIRDWHPCTEENKFGYHKSAPCVFLKLNKVYNWVPECYNDTRDLPADMPEHLKKIIEETPASKRNNVWIECHGETPADKENIGQLTYISNVGVPGFPAYYFPYQNVPGYLSPLVAVHFQNPPKVHVVNVECRAWAKNIHYKRKDRSGSIHFELQVDPLN